ncbi:MAG: hypothetical protein WBV84_10675, partial [Nitrososphaeraceae archaeon]
MKSDDIHRNIIHGILLMIFSTSVVTLSDHYQAVLAHDFSTTDDSSLATLVEEIKAETQLVIADFLSNNNNSADVHARNAAGL